MTNKAKLSIFLKHRTCYFISCADCRYVIWATPLLSLRRIRPCKFNRDKRGELDQVSLPPTQLAARKVLINPGQAGSGERSCCVLCISLCHITAAKHYIHHMTYYPRPTYTLTETGRYHHQAPIAEDGRGRP